ncbi:Uu.00g107630.m01.CDS01 [Anthostomella pinea]|uniref:Uu.00g107630.m01.CDS01 n=1 Tax=Anthostomella pinea TaxID=933095 RepID=A0AAI8VF23_9PEZI|nr:Uu.00g107630.m01.CDS01 [Anthostomella pinea]
MSASRNPDSVAQQGEFHSRVPPSEPLTTKGHKPGVLVGNDAVPEFHAETHTSGTAPPKDSYRPNPVGEVPGQALNDQTATRTDPADTLGGATSASVHTGLGKPMQGQTSTELHGDHKNRSGLEGRGASVGMKDVVREKGADLPEGVYKGMKGGKASPDYPAAEDRPPVSAESVASERK